MALRESSQRLLRVDPADVEALEEAIRARGRDVAEYAGRAHGAELVESYRAGQVAIARLMEERARLLRELMRARSLRSGLDANTEAERSSIYG